MEVGARHDGLCDPLAMDIVGAYAVWVIVDRLTKSTHVLVVRMTFTFEEFDRLYIREIVQLYGVSVSIITDRDPRFTAQFWRSFQRAMGTQMRMSIVFHS